MIDYRIVSDKSQAPFEDKCKKLLNEGWKLSGGVSQTEGYNLIQAFTKSGPQVEAPDSRKDLDTIDMTMSSDLLRDGLIIPIEETST